MESLEFKLLSDFDVTATSYYSHAQRECTYSSLDPMVRYLRIGLRGLSICDSVPLLQNSAGLKTNKICERHG